MKNWQRQQGLVLHLNSSDGVLTIHGCNMLALGSTQDNSVWTEGTVPRQLQGVSQCWHDEQRCQWRCKCCTSMVHEMRLKRNHWHLSAPSEILDNVTLMFSAAQTSASAYTQQLSRNARALIVRVRTMFMPPAEGRTLPWLRYRED